MTAPTLRSVAVIVTVASVLAVAGAASVSGADDTGGEAVALVDTTVADHGALASAASDRGLTVVNISSAADARAALDDRADLRAVHLLSHGTVGTVTVGDDTLTSETLDRYGELTTAIDESLAPGGDLLLYGCRVATNGTGESFVTAVADVTDGDVAASNDLTGGTDHGGDWELEASVGSISTAAVDTTATEFGGVLSVPNDEMYDENLGQTFSTTSFSLDNVAYSLDSPVTSEVTNVGLLGDGGVDYAMVFDFDGSTTLRSVTVSTDSGGSFDLRGLSIADNSVTGNVILASSAGGSKTICQGQPCTEENIGLSGNSNFQDITSFTIKTTSSSNIIPEIDDIDFESANTPPSVDTNDGLTVDEGSNATVISTTELDASDVDGDSLTYDVTSGVSHGTLFIDGSSGGTDDGTLDGESPIGTGTFTQTNVSNGDLLYNHDGSATTSDGFDFDLKDGNGGTVTGQRFSISVTAAPTVTSITRAAPTSQATTADAVTYNVTFSESVSGVATGDLTVADNAGGTATIGSVTEEDTNADGDDVWQVTVDSITGDGQLRLDLTDDDGITSDATGIPLGGVGTSGDADGGYTSGEPYSIDNTAPGFDSGASPSVAEGTTGSVLDVEAGDDGTATPDTDVSYSLAGVDAGPFSIDSNTGELSLDSAQDFESPGDADGGGDYELTVTATDDAGNSAEQSVTVAVTDVNEAPAAPTDSDGTTDGVAETAANGATVGVDVGTTDPEGDATTWSLDDDANGRFDIDTDGVVTVADASKIDYETTTSHTITVNASDSSLSATKAITISVTDAAEPPSFKSGTSAGVTESATAGATVQDVNATVGGANDTGVGYAITAGNDDVAGDGGGAFAIDSNTGQLTVNDADDIDESELESFILSVEASEGAQSVVQDVTISITDDVAPSFEAGASDPADGSTNHVPSEAIDLNFDESVTLGSGDIRIVDDGDGSSTQALEVTTGDVTASGRTVTVSPPSTLEADTAYHIEIDGTAIEDAYGNSYAGFADSTTYDLTTADTTPSFTGVGSATVTVDEDGSVDLTSALAVVDVSSSDTLTWSVASVPSNGMVTGVDGETSAVSGSDSPHTLAGSPTYAPDGDFNGADAFDVRVSDANPGTSATITVSVTVDSVNDAPSVTLGGNQTVNGTTGQQTVEDFASFAPGGGGDEAGQSVEDYTLTVASDPEGVLSAVDIDNDGNLTYTATDSVEGTASVDVVVTDDGSTTNGGSNNSAPTSFNITVDTQSPTVETASTTAGTLRLTMNEPLSTAAANTPPGENFTVTAGGSRITVSDVTISASVISLDLSDSVSFGEMVTLNYTQGTNISEDLSTNQLANITAQPVTNTVPRPNRDADDDDGGGGGGGGGGSPADDGDTGETISVPVTPTDSGTTSTAQVETGEDGTVSLEFTAEETDETTEPDAARESNTDETTDDATDDSAGDSTGDERTDPAPAELTRLDIRTTADTAGKVTVEQTESADEITAESVEPLDSVTDSEPAGYVSVETDFDDRVESAIFEVSVPAERFDDREAADATVYHYVDREWTPLETDLVGNSGEAYTFEATSDGFSTFAVGINSVGDSDGENASTTEANTSTDALNEETPGFSVAVAVLSILTVAVTARLEGSPPLE